MSCQLVLLMSTFGTDPRGTNIGKKKRVGVCEPVILPVPRPIPVVTPATPTPVEPQKEPVLTPVEP